MIYEDEDELEHAKEIHLSNGKLLLIFLGAAVVCGACFGFGYSLGKHSAPPVAVAPATDAAPQQTPAASNKPSAGYSSQPATPPPAPADTPITTTVATDDSATVVTPPPAEPAPAPKSVPVIRSAPAEPPPVVRTVTVKPDPVQAPVAAAVTGGRSYVVQVAAVSHQGDADMLVAALHRKGYQVTASPGTDSLIHVQVGPFANQKDAATMRDRLANDGYNAIVK